MLLTYLQAIVIGASLGVILACLTYEMDHAIKSAFVPPSRFKSTVAALALGDSGWAVPWMLRRDIQGNFYLPGDIDLVEMVPAAFQFNTTLRMQVKRTRQGLCVDFSKCEAEVAVARDTCADHTPGDAVRVHRVTGLPGTNWLARLGTLGLFGNQVAA